MPGGSLAKEDEDWEGPSEDICEYCPACGCITQQSFTHCPLCRSRLPPVHLRPRADKPKLAAVWWFCRKLWFMLGGFVLEGNASIQQEMSRGMLIEADDSWNELYPAEQVERILRLAKVFPVTGRYFGEAVPRGPMDGVHIHRGKTLVEVVGRNKLVNFSIPSATKANKQYSVWVIRPHEEDRAPRKANELFISCTCADHCYAIRGPDYEGNKPCLHGAAVVVALSQMALALPREEVPRKRQPSAKSRAAAAMRSGSEVRVLRGSEQ